jgi:hypothetical protein
MSRKKKPKQATYPDQDVDHNRPSLEREIEMLREENVRLIGRVNRQTNEDWLRALQVRIDTLQQMLRDVALSGVELDDDRMSYVIVQVDKDVWRAVKVFREYAAAGVKP